MRRVFNDTFVDLGRQLRMSYVPPLMVYLAYGISGLTGIVGVFFVKDYLDLSAAFLAGLGFWAGIPWVLKMPLGHLVDVIWRYKSLLVYFGAALLTASIAIMYGLITFPEAMAAVLPAEVWFVTSALLSPTGLVVQDVVADAMTVEAVPLSDDRGRRYGESELKAMHTTMQMLGRFAIVTGGIGVSVLNVVLFAGVEEMTEADKVAVYGQIFLIALVIPLISVAGVVLGEVALRRRARRLRAEGIEPEEVERIVFIPPEDTRPDWWILGGSFAFIAFTLSVGLAQLPLGQEIIFVGSLAIIGFLMRRLLLALDPVGRRALIGTALIIFVFRAVPMPGPGATWFEIDTLGFDQQFIGILSLITSGLALAGMLFLRPTMARHSIALIVAVLSIAAGVLSLPNIGLYYGVHEWTASVTGGVVDARFIAVLDTAIESPLVQIAMIPMLAWIAKNAPANLKATFFAVMASFTNLALSASSLGTKYMNEIFTVTREVRDAATGVVEVAADYSELGWLLITVAVVGLTAPLVTIALVQISRFRTRE
jgi:hypothetical protein